RPPPEGPPMKSTLVLLLMVAATPAAAQHAGLSFAISPYAWFPSLTSSVSTARGTIETETSASDLISELDAVFMGLVEARNGRWGLLADVFYTDISQSQRTPLGRLYSRARVESTLTVASGYAAYRV